jgi:flagellar biosynthesis GTPase FlhF
MKVVSFVAPNPATALDQILGQLGPEAIVLRVRPVPASGWSRLWQQHRALEVLACVRNDLPGKPADESLSPSWPSASKNAWSEIRSLLQDEGTNSLPQFSNERAAVAPEETPGQLAGKTPALRHSAPRAQFVPRTTHHIIPAFTDDPTRPHVFIGPPGSGKTTLLCKWMVSAVLTEERPVRLWRLDGANANTAEMLNVYAEMFGVTVERSWRVPELQLDANGLSSTRGGSQSLLLIDLPGVEIDNPQAANAFKTQLASLHAPHVHLVLNAAYDLPILLEQYRAFNVFRPNDVSFTHLDEEKGSEKIRDFAASTGSSLRFLSAGQKVPGEFVLVDGLQPIVQKEPANMALSARQPATAATWQSTC